MKKIAVIGGGPAGIIAAGISSKEGNDVTLYEKNDKLGKKLFITGKGRCNITNSSSIDNLLENIVTNKEFLYSSFYSFTNTDIINLLKLYGLETIIERGNRVFPKTNKSSDVLKTFNKFLSDTTVKIKLNSNIKSIEYKNDKFIINNLTYDSVIITTGGKTYPSTGSTGDGYVFAKHFGHTIKDTIPALASMELSNPWIHLLQGLSLKNIKLSAYRNKKIVYSDLGEMIFTHYGISGPVVLSMSSYINKYDNSDIQIVLDLKPGLDFEKLEARIMRDFEKYSNKNFKNSLFDLLPKKMIPIIIELSGINENKKISQINKKERNDLVSLLKNIQLNFENLRPLNEAIITSGGVSTKEINSSTMESKIIKNLYFAGEIIDVDALTGGYNLQIAYSTGYLAGLNA